MEIPLIFGLGLQGKSPVVTAQKRQNLYFEFQKQTDRTLVAAYPTAGLNAPFVDFGDTAVRGGVQVGPLMYVVHRGTFYSVNAAGVKTSIGTLNTTSGVVDMAYNGVEILIVDGTNGYLYHISEGMFFQIKQYSTGTTSGTTSGKLVDSGASFDTDGTKAGMTVRNTTDSTKTRITAVDSATTLSVEDDIFTTGEDYEVGEGDFPDTATTCDHQDGYFLVEKDDKFYISNLIDGMTWDATEFATAEHEPDGVVRLISDHGEVILFGEQSTEYWGNTGALDFPFTRKQGTSDEWGLAAKWSVAKFDNSLMYLAQNTMGEAMLVRSAGYLPQPIDDDEFHSIINDYDDLTDARGFAYLMGGHPFYQITFPGAGESWLYDGKTQLISQLKSEGLTRHRADLYIKYQNENYVTDYTLGRIYKLNDETYTDNGGMIQRRLRSAHVFNKSHKEMVVDRFEVLMETGVGTASGEGSDPKIMLRVSKDLGRTWSKELTRSIGKIGEYRKRVLFDDLGSARDFIFEITISDPVKTVITGANVVAREAVVGKQAA